MDEPVPPSRLHIGGVPCNLPYTRVAGTTELCPCEATLRQRRCDQADAGLRRENLPASPRPTSCVTAVSLADEGALFSLGT